MKSKLIITALLLTLNQLVLAQTANDYVNQGRAFLSATNIVAANNSFSNAVALSPGHQTANVFYAATRLLVLPYQAAGSNFLNRIGLPTIGRDIYNWTAELPADTNGVPLAPAGVNANEFTAMARTNVLPAVIAAEANLAQVTDTNFTLALTSNETRTVGVTLDYGDILLLRAMLQAAEYFAYTTYSGNLDFQLAAIRSLYTNGQLSIERMLADYPNLLTFATTNDLSAARTAFTNGVDRYLQASQIIRNRTNVTRLFNYDSGQSESEQTFRLTIADLKNSLNGAVPLTVDSRFTAFMPAAFSGAHTARSFLPVFRGNGFGLGTFPDYTFGGLIYGLTQPDVDGFLAGYLPPIPTISPMFNSTAGQFQFPINVAAGNGYVVQVSSNLLNWTDHTAFVALGETYNFTDPSFSFSRRYYRVVDRTINMPPPVNDNFTNKIALSGLGIVATGYNSSASVQAGETGYYAGKTVWWSWTSPVSFSGNVVIDTAGSTFTPYIRVYTGASLAALSVVSSGSGRVSFTASSGTTYQIQVDGYYSSPNTGGIRLTITAPPTLTVTSPLNGAQFTAPGNIFISASASDPDGSITKLELRGNGALLGSTTNTSLSLTWTNIGPGFCNVQVTATDNLGVKTSSSLSVTVHPQNDDFVNRITLNGTNVTTLGTNEAGTKENGEPNHAGDSGGRSVWWSWTSPFSGSVTVIAEMVTSYGYHPTPLLGIYTGASVSSLSTVANSSVANGSPAQASFTAASGATYYIAVDGQYGYSGNITLKVIPTQPPTVAVLSPADGSVLNGPTNITISASATDSDGSISKLEFRGDGLLLGSISGASFSLTWSNVNLGSHSIVVTATDNLGALASSNLIVTLVVPPPPNDNFASRISIGGAIVNTNGNNAGATKEINEPYHAGYYGGKSVWWSWIAPANGTFYVTVTTSGVYYPLLAVYTGTQLTSLSTVTSGFGSGYTRQLALTATAGQTYQIAIDDYYGNGSSYTLNISP